MGSKFNVGDKVFLKNMRSRATITEIIKISEHGYLYRIKRGNVTWLVAERDLSLEKL